MGNVYTNIKWIDQKQEQNFVAKLSSVLFAILNSGSGVECRLDFDTGLKHNVVVGY